MLIEGFLIVSPSGVNLQGNVPGIDGGAVADGKIDAISAGFARNGDLCARTVTNLSHFSNIRLKIFAHDRPTIAGWVCRRIVHDTLKLDGRARSESLRRRGNLDDHRPGGCGPACPILFQRSENGFRTPIEIGDAKPGGRFFVTVAPGISDTADIVATMRLGMDRPAPNIALSLFR